MQPQMEKAIRTLETDLRALWPQMQDLLENQLSADLQKEARQSLPDFAGQRRELSDAIQSAFIDILTGKALHEKLGECFAQTSVLLRVSVGVLGIAAALGAFLMAPNLRLVCFVVAGIAALWSAVLAFNHQRKVHRACEAQLSPKRTEFTRILEQEFARAIDSFCAQMEQKIRALSDACESRLRRYQPSSERANDLETRLNELKTRLG
jgi:hypothetical protein